MSKFITVTTINLGKKVVVNVDKIERIDVDTSGKAIITLPQSRFSTEEDHETVLGMIQRLASVITPSDGASW